jgi:hypothetical protein
VLLDWLSNMAGDVSDESARLAARHGISVDGRPEIVTLRAARPAIFGAVSQFLNDGDADVRTSAVTAAAQLLDARELAGHREALLTPMKDVLVNSRDGHRARVKSTLLSWSEKPPLVGDFAKAVADAVISSSPEPGTDDPPF